MVLVQLKKDDNNDLTKNKEHIGASIHKEENQRDNQGISGQLGTTKNAGTDRDRTWDKPGTNKEKMYSIKTDSKNVPKNKNTCCQKRKKKHERGSEVHVEPCREFR